MGTPIVSSKYWWMYQFCKVKVTSFTQNGISAMLDTPGRDTLEVK